MPNIWFYVCVGWRCSSSLLKRDRTTPFHQLRHQPAEEFSGTMAKPNRTRIIMSTRWRFFGSNLWCWLRAKDTRSVTLNEPSIQHEHETAAVHHHNGSLAADRDEILDLVTQDGSNHKDKNNASDSGEDHYPIAHGHDQ